MVYALALSALACQVIGAIVPCMLAVAADVPEPEVVVGVLSQIRPRSACFRCKVLRIAKRCLYARSRQTEAPQLAHRAKWAPPLGLPTVKSDPTLPYPNPPKPYKSPMHVAVSWA